MNEGEKFLRMGEEKNLRGFRRIWEKKRISIRVSEEMRMRKEEGKMPRFAFYNDTREITLTIGFVPFRNQMSRSYKKIND